jgi:murein DD-endopeptidase MepM/ murein hydrolase activator NlpD
VILVGAITVLLSTTTLMPGETLRVEVDGPIASVKPQATFMGKMYPFYIVGPNAQRALMGMRLDADPGSYDLVVKTTDGKLTESERHAIRISTKTFKTENVNFSKTKTELMKAERRESKIIGKNKMYLSRDQQWESLFMYPVEGPVIGEYGIKRLRNGTIPAGFHKGVDLRAAKGTPLLAANSGTVMLASNFRAHGKTVLLNHGQGVMTIYLHMDSIAVRVGQKVRKGEMLGKVGSTGLSTAPHVHYQVFVHGVPVDPAQWVQNEF